MNEVFKIANLARDVIDSERALDVYLDRVVDSGIEVHAGCTIDNDLGIG